MQKSIENWLIKAAKRLNDTDLITFTLVRPVYLEEVDMVYRGNSPRMYFRDVSAASEFRFSAKRGDRIQVSGYSDKGRWLMSESLGEEIEGQLRPSLNLFSPEGSGTEDIWCFDGPTFKVADLKAGKIKPSEPRC